MRGSIFIKTATLAGILTGAGPARAAPLAQRVIADAGVPVSAWHRAAPLIRDLTSQGGWDCPPRPSETGADTRAFRSWREGPAAVTDPQVRRAAATDSDVRGYANPIPAEAGPPAPEPVLAVRAGPAPDDVPNQGAPAGAGPHGSCALADVPPRVFLDPPRWRIGPSYDYTLPANDGVCLEAPPAAGPDTPDPEEVGPACAEAPAAPRRRWWFNAGHLAKWFKGDPVPEPQAVTIPPGTPMLSPNGEGRP